MCNSRDVWCWWYIGCDRDTLVLFSFDTNRYISVGIGIVCLLPVSCTRHVLVSLLSQYIYKHLPLYYATLHTVPCTPGPGCLSIAGSRHSGWGGEVEYSSDSGRDKLVLESCKEGEGHKISWEVLNRVKKDSNPTIWNHQICNLTTVPLCKLNS